MNSNDLFEDIKNYLIKNPNRTITDIAPNYPIFGERTIQKTLKKMERDGIVRINKVRGEKGGNNTNHYEVII